MLSLMHLRLLKQRALRRFRPARQKPPPQVDALAARIVGAHRTGDSVPIIDDDPRYWVMAVDQLLDRGILAPVAHAIPALSARFPQTVYFASVATALASMPPPTGDATFDAFVDDRSAVQLVRREGAEAVLLAFCAMDRATLPLGLIQRWFGPLGVDVLYLRDRSNNLFHDGIAALGPDLGTTIDRLRVLTGGRRLFCYGGSKGGYGALLYGVWLDAEAVLALSPPTSITDSSRFVLGFGANAVDLRDAYTAAPSPPRVHLVYAGGLASDRRHAEHLAGVAGVSVEEVGGANHNVAMDLIRTGRFAPLLRGLVDSARRDTAWASQAAG